jgi:hypothetical protein
MLLADLSLADMLVCGDVDGGDVKGEVLARHELLALVDFSALTRLPLEISQPGSNDKGRM